MKLLALAIDLSFMDGIFTTKFVLFVLLCLGALVVASKTTKK